MYQQAGPGRSKRIDRVKRIYSDAGYKCVVTSAATGYGLDERLTCSGAKSQCLPGRAVWASPKLISALLGVELLTGELSQALRRGRHTTRWVSLLRTPETAACDTPGFSRIDLVDVEPHDELLYPEFREHAVLCHFPRCLHKTERRCAVLEALDRGEIPRDRHDNYLMFLEELIERAKRKYE